MTGGKSKEDLAAAKARADDDHSNLTIRDKLAYGIGTLGNCATFLIGFFWSAYLQNIQMNTGQASIAQLIPKVWDALIDPIIGYFSDGTRTRFGRRRPWLLGAAVPVGITFILIWWFPAGALPANGGETSAGLFAWFLIIYCLQRTAYTSYMVPYAALTMELSPKESDRTTLTSVRFFFGGIANLICVAIFGAIPTGYIDRWEDEHGVEAGPLEYRRATSAAAIIVGFIVTTAILVSFFLFKERDFEQISKDTHSISVKEGVKVLFKNRAFMTLTGMTATLFLGLQLVQANMIQFYVYSLGLERATANNCVLVTLGTLIVVVPCIRIVLARVPKKGVWLFGLVLFASWCCAAWQAPHYTLHFQMPPTNPMQPIFDEFKGFAFYLSFHFGCVLGVMFYIPWTMIPECIDVDELATGVRREGFYYSVYIFFEKVASGIGLSVAGFVLDQHNYNPSTPIPNFQAGVGDVFRNVITLGPFVVLCLSGICLFFYPITTAKRYQIQADLIERRKAAADGVAEGSSMLLASDDVKKSGALIEN